MRGRVWGHAAQWGSGYICALLCREELPTIYKCPHQGCTAVYRGADGMKVRGRGSTRRVCRAGADSSSPGPGQVELEPALLVWSVGQRASALVSWGSTTSHDDGWLGLLLEVLGRAGSRQPICVARPGPQGLPVPPAEAHKGAPRGGPGEAVPPPRLQQGVHDRPLPSAPRETHPHRCPPCPPTLTCRPRAPSRKSSTVSQCGVPVPFCRFNTVGGCYPYLRDDIICLILKVIHVHHTSCGR